MSFLTQKEMAAELKVSVKTLQRWRRKGWLKFFEFGHRTIRYSTNDLEKLRHASASPK